MNVAAAVMVMSNRERTMTVPISVGVQSLVRSDMDMGDIDMGGVVIVVGFDQSDSRPIGGVPQCVLRLRKPMQVHGRQDGDAQTDAEVAEGVRQ